ncbi:hypothetical protein PPL_10505 [Heterostelium album PN500]|uniref:Uncharacterized protein n=1 Tax=Heterostelium pallidum (strain ATCC 26659 / Pp 5 / PN500) TaxID=670386 RepID=D3BR99_HETP5|nr:hypothetical protein PPL_10505 [Heterostelium album PN500]EFA75931.1 hypothetical protein PPL_10505 [Heterostelium album PN500]|eukprot:XP_020428065.1 hypothetical protein PPL_10505 [Heterostelium album PN500]
MSNSSNDFLSYYEDRLTDYQRLIRKKNLFSGITAWSNKDIQLLFGSFNQFQSFYDLKDYREAKEIQHLLKEEFELSLLSDDNYTDDDDEDDDDEDDDDDEPFKSAKSYYVFFEVKLSFHQQRLRYQNIENGLLPYSNRDIDIVFGSFANFMNAYGYTDFRQAKYLQKLLKENYFNSPDSDEEEDYDDEDVKWSDSFINKWYGSFNNFMLKKGITKYKTAKEHQALLMFFELKK